MRQKYHVRQTHPKQQIQHVTEYMALREANASVRFVVLLELTAPRQRDGAARPRMACILFEQGFLLLGSRNFLLKKAVEAYGKSGHFFSTPRTKVRKEDKGSTGL